MRLILRELRTGVRRVYGLLDPLLMVGGGEGGGRRGYGLRVLGYLLKTFLGTSSLATLVLMSYNRRLRREGYSHP